MMQSKVPAISAQIWWLEAAAPPLYYKACSHGLANTASLRRHGLSCDVPAYSFPTFSITDLQHW